MKPFSNRQLTAAAGICAILLAAILWVLFENTRIKTESVTPAIKKEIEGEEPLPPKELKDTSAPEYEIIGYSAQNRPIEIYRFGNGGKLLVFAGAIHGGYEWNSALLAWEFIDYLETNPEIVPKNLSVAVIPALNPDGLAKIAGKEGRFAAADIPAGTNETGRFNANNVDLNRNFDCNWQPKGIWRQKEVNAGSAAFSEPESAALRDYVLKNKPAAVVFWHSQSNAVYGSMCNADMSDETRAILNAYAKASGYPAKDTFDQYQVSGDATDWLASIHISAITVELATHQSIEWQKNLAGINALFQYFK
ncbi:MAG TPA: M14 family metallopeptidase [Candidatus Pacearchaeota archaeon]|nr:M14 family metallopeptidase [Candidatus Pacearchaeota archaeon]